MVAKRISAAAGSPACANKGAIAPPSSSAMIPPQPAGIGALVAGDQSSAPSPTSNMPMKL